MSSVGVIPEVVGWSRPGIVTYVLLTILLATFLAWYNKKRHMVAMVNKLPGPKDYPIVGNALDMMKDSEGMFQQLLKYCDYGEVMRFWLGPSPLVLLSSPRAVETLFSSQVSIDKSKGYAFLHPWLGTGLLTSTGSKWRSRRKLLTPAFHFKILENFVEVFNRQASTMLGKLQGKADGSLFDIYPYITLCTLDIICETAMGRTVNAQDDQNSEYVRAVKRINETIVQRSFRVWQQPDFLYWLLGLARQRDSYIKVLHKFSRDTVRERRALYHQLNKSVQVPTEEDKLIGKKKQLAFLDLLLEASNGGQNLTDDDIREEVDTFMFEGHDTITVAMNWALYFLGRHPEIQARVHDELDSIFGDSDRPVTSADLREMKYLEMCIKEALRLMPSVPNIARKLGEELVVGDKVVPAGVNATIMMYKIHRDPEHFADPEKFDPDRHLPETVSKRHPFAFVPFSAGPRNCIGQKFAVMEEKTVLGRVLRQYRVESDTPYNNLKLKPELVLRPKNGNFLRLYPRKP